MLIKLELPYEPAITLLGMYPDKTSEGGTYWEFGISRYKLLYIVQLLSCVQLFATPWTAACQASLSITKLWELAQTHVHRVGDAIQQSHPLPSPYRIDKEQGPTI